MPYKASAGIFFSPKLSISIRYINILFSYLFSPQIPQSGTINFLVIKPLLQSGSFLKLPTGQFLNSRPPLGDLEVLNVTSGNRFCVGKDIISCNFIRAEDD